MIVTQRADGQWAVTDANGKVVSVHKSNAKAWRAADRASNEPVNSREDHGDQTFRRSAAGGVGLGPKPFFTWPLERFRELIVPVANGIRSLPEHQLLAELEQLRAICAEEGWHLSESLLLGIYEAETSRRADPERQFDDALDLALGRLERQTNPEDRAFVHEVGRRLHAIGGRAALDRAYGRMMGLAGRSKFGVRETVLSKRWAGIDHIEPSTRPET